MVFAFDFCLLECFHMVSVSEADNEQEERINSGTMTDSRFILQILCP